MAKKMSKIADQMVKEITDKLLDLEEEKS